MMAVCAASTIGALFLAREMQKLESPPSNPERLPRRPATATLLEYAAAHDGKTPAEWLRMFRKLWRSGSPDGSSKDGA